MENKLLEALKVIESLCDNQNPTHENIWRVAYYTIQEAEAEQKLQQHSVMQGCQCKDRIGETTVWCCNQCGLPCEQGWLPTYKPVRQPTVADGAVGKGVSAGCSHRDTITESDGYEYCADCGDKIAWH